MKYVLKFRIEVSFEINKDDTSHRIEVLLVEQKS